MFNILVYCNRRPGLTINLLTEGTFRRTGYLKIRMLISIGDRIHKHKVVHQSIEIKYRKIRVFLYNSKKPLIGSRPI